MQSYIGNSPIVILINYYKIELERDPDKAKPFERKGQKATGLISNHETAGLPKVEAFSMLGLFSFD